MCYRGGESTVVHFPILLRLPDLSSLSLPSASSAESERDFSGAGNDIEEQRSQRKPSSVDDVLFLQSNLKQHVKPQMV